MNTMLVGEAPSKTGVGRQPFDGGRLERLLGVRPPILFDTVNLLEYWPGSNGKGSGFPAAEARAAAAALNVAGRRVILAGRRVAAAFGLPADLPWFEWIDHREAIMAVMPHPSGVNRWWNDQDNERRAVLWMRRWV